MLRLSFLTQCFATTTPVYKGYTIKRLAYLVEAPPARPLNSWARYVIQQTKGKQNIKVSQNTTALSQKWKKQPELRQKLKKQFENENKEYLKLKQQYEAKYAVPFKRVNNVTLFVTNFYKNNKNKLQSKDVRQYAKVWTSQFQKVTPEEREKLTAEANRINSKRKKLQEKLRFPIRQYFTEAAYSKSHKVSKTLGVREKKRQQRQQYQLYVQKWQAEVEQWLKQNEYDISIEDFTKLYDKTYKKLQKAKEQKKQKDQEQDQSEDD